MLVMQEYLLRHIGAQEALSGLLGSAFSTGPDLPKFLQDQLIFPYLDGMRFAQALKEQDGGGWTLLDLAARDRVPDSTEQILHPEKWVEVETPDRVTLDVDLGPGWRRTARGTWGEWQTGALDRRRRRGLGRRPLRAVAARHVRSGAVPQRGCAGDALELGHGRGRPRVRGRAARGPGREC